MKTTQETWLPLPGYRGYLISNKGNIIRVYPNNTAREVTTRIDWGGYVTVRLYLDGKSITRYVHRLVAQTFIDNPDGKQYVNHKNGIKTDNHACNLEWATHAENIQHAYDNGLISRERASRPVVDTCLGFTFKSIKEAAGFHQIPYSTAKGYLNGSRPNPTCLRYM